MFGAISLRRSPNRTSWRRLLTARAVRPYAEGMSGAISHDGACSMITAIMARIRRICLASIERATAPIALNELALTLTRAWRRSVVIRDRDVQSVGSNRVDRLRDALTSWPSAMSDRKGVGGCVSAQRPELSLESRTRPGFDSLEPASSSFDEQKRCEEPSRCVAYFASASLPSALVNPSVESSDSTYGSPTSRRHRYRHPHSAPKPIGFRHLPERGFPLRPASGLLE